MIKKRIVALMLVLLTLAGAVILIMPRQVNLVYMADSKYIPYVMVSLHSAILNKNASTAYHVHVIAKDISPAQKQQLQSMQQDTVKIHIVPAKELDLDYAHLGRFASFKISLQKLFIAEYLPDVGKALYLDADTLVQEDLYKVYQTGLRDKYAAAVKDGLMYQAPEHIAELNLKNPQFYFNSGVMLLNLDNIRKDNIIRRAVIYFNTHNEVFGDQDILNSVFGKKVVPMSYRYNCNSTFFEEKSAAFLSAFWQEEVPENSETVYQNAAILHFAGHKPWTPMFTHPYLKPLWWRYAEDVMQKYKISF